MLQVYCPALENEAGTNSQTVLIVHCTIRS